MKSRIIALVAFLVVSGLVVADERTFHFSGTLEGDTRCPPSDGEFCGPYRGTLTLDDDQDAIEWIPGRAYHYRYAAAEVVFADGQTVTSKSPSTLPPMQSAIAGVTPKLRVETSGNYLHITIDMHDPKAAFGVIAPQYHYGQGTFDPADLRDVLKALCGKSSIAKFVVGGACSWGPCLDRSLTPLRSTATVKNVD